MEAETNSPEDASAVSVPLVKSITNIGSEQIKFLQINGDELNSRYPLAEETRKVDSSKTNEVSETRPEEIYHESSKACVESGEQTEHQPEGQNTEKKILRHADSGLVTTESIPKSSELEDESTSTSPELAINQGEIAEKSFEKEAYKEEDSTAINNDQSCRPKNELEQRRKALEDIDLTQYTGKDTTDNEHFHHQSEAPRMENDAKEKLVIENDGKFDQEEAKGIEDPTKTQLLNTAKERVTEDESLQTLPTAASVGNVEADERSQEEIQEEAELVMTYTKEVQTQQNELDEKKDIPEEGTEFSAGNGKVSEYQPASQKEETTFIQQQHSNENTAEIYPTNDTEEQEVPASDNKEKDDGKFNQEEAKQSEDPAKSVQEDESVQTLPMTTSIEKEAVDESSQEEKHQEPELEVTYTKEDDTGLSAENKKKSEPDVAVKEPHLNEETAETNPTNDTAEKELTASNANKKLVAQDLGKLDQEKAQQIKEPMKSLPEDESLQTLTTAASIENDIVDEHAAQGDQTSTVGEVHLNEETRETNPINENVEQEEEDPTSKTTKKLVIHDDGKLDHEVAEQIEEPIKNVQEDESVQTLPTTTSVENEAVDESSQEEKHHEQELEVTHTKEDEKEFSAENKLESEAKDGTQTKEATTVREPHLNEETSEINPINDNAEREEVPASDAIKKIVVEDVGILDPEEAEHIQELKKSLPEDESLQTLPTTASIENDVVEEPAAHGDQTSTVRELHLNEETKETNPINNNVEQEEDSTSETTKKLAIHDDGKLDQEEAEQIEEQIKSLHEDESVKILPTTTSVENEAVDESCQEEKHCEPELEVTYTKEDETELSAENKRKSEPDAAVKELHLNEETAETNPINVTAEKEHLASNANKKLADKDLGKLDQEEAQQIKEPTKKSVENDIVDVPAAQSEQTTTVRELHSNEETAESKPIKETVEQEVPTSDTTMKLVIDDDGKLDQEEAEEIEEPIKCGQEDESVLTLPMTTSVENEADDGSSQEEKHQEPELEVTYTTKVQTQQNEFEVKKDIAEDQTELSVENKQESEAEAATQTEEATTVNEQHLNVETAQINPINDTVEKKEFPASNAFKKVVVKDVGKLDQEPEHIEEPTKSLPENESLQTLPTAASVENNVVDEPAAQNEQTSTVREQHLSEETAETNPNNKTVEQEVPTSDTTEKLVIDDGGKLDQDEVELIEKPTKSLQEDESVQQLPTATSVENEVDDDSSKEENHQKAQLEVTYTQEAQTPSLFKLASGVQDQTEYRAEIKEESEAEAATQTKEATTVKEQQQTTEINPINDTADIEEVPASDVINKIVAEDVGKHDQEEAEHLGESMKSLPEDESFQTLPTAASVKNNVVGEPAAQSEQTSTVREQHFNEETAETNPPTETVEQEIPTPDTTKNLEIEDGSKLDQDQAEQIQKPTKSLLEDESVQQLPVATSVKNEADDESSQEEKQQEVQLEVTYTKEVQTQHNEFDTRKDISEDQTDFSAENKLESEAETAAQTKEATTAKEPHSNEETTEINPINDTAQTEEVRASNVINKIVTEGVGKLDQEEADHLEESSKNEFLQLLPTAASVENDVVDDTAAQSEQTSTVREPHLNEDTAETSSINETLEQEVPTFDTTKKLVIDDGGKLDQDEEQIEEPTKSLQEHESVQQLSVATSVENEADDESSKEEKQQEAQLEETYTKEVPIQHNEFDTKKDIPEDQTEFSAENKLESEAEAATQIKEATTAKEPHSNEENTEINPINDTAQTEELPASNVINKIVTEDVGKLDQEEEEHLEESSKSLPEDESFQKLPTAASVENDVVDERATQSEQTSTVRELHLNEETAETRTINKTVEQEVPTPDTTEKLEIDDGGKLDQDEVEQIEKLTKSLLEDESVQQLPVATTVENEADDESSQEEKQQEAQLEVTYSKEVQTQQNEFDTRKDISEDQTDFSAENKLESEAEAATQTKEATTAQEPHSNEETTEINPINDTAQTEEVPASHVINKIVTEDVGKHHQEGTDYLDTSTQSLPEDESLQIVPTTASVKNDVVDEPAAQSEQMSTVRELHFNDETAETGPINETEEQEDPTFDTIKKFVINDGGKLDQGEEEQIEELTKSLQDDESVKQLPVATSVENEADDESSPDEKQLEAQLEVTYTKEVQTQHNEFDTTKDIPEDQTEFSTENKLKPEAEATTQTKEATTAQEPHSYEDTREINPINGTAETAEVPASNVINKIVTEDVGKLDQEEADHLEESTKSLPENESFQILPTAESVENDIVDEPAAQSEQTSKLMKLHLNEEPAETSPINETVEQEVSTFDTTKKLVIDDGGKLDQNEEQIEEPTKSLQEDESVQQLPAATSVENEADDECSPEQKQQAQLEATYTKEVQTQHNEFDTTKDIPEDQKEFSAENKLEPEAEATTQTKEATTAQGAHSNEDTTEINPINDTAETEEVPASGVIKEIVTEDVGKPDKEEADHLEESSKSLLENESFQILPTATSVENNVVDKPAAQSEQTSTVRELHLNEEPGETSPINETVEQEATTFDTTKKLVIDDGGKLHQNVEQIEEPTKSLQEDESVQQLPVATSVENEADEESSKEEKQQEAQLEETYTKEVLTQHNEFDTKKDIPEDQTEFNAENKLESEAEAPTQTKEATTAKEPHSNEETTEINPINDTAQTEELPASNVINKIVTEDVGKLDQEEADHLEESPKSLPEGESFQKLPTAASVENDVVDERATQSEQTSTVRELHLNEETAETSTINETVEQEVPTPDTTEKLEIDDGGKLDQDEVEQIEKPTKSLQEDESVQQLPVATSFKNEADDESSQEEKQEEAQLEMTYTKEVQTQHNEFDTTKDIPEDQTEFSAENKLESEAEATTQTKEATTAQEPHSNEDTPEINAMNDTAEADEVPASDVINKIVTEDVSKPDQVEADHLEESTKSLAEDQSFQILPTTASVENDVVDDTAAQSEQTSTVRELHMNEETAETSPINENVEQELPTVDTTKKFVIDDGGKLDQDEEQIEEPTKSLQEDESVQQLPIATSVKNEADDESSKEEKQQEAQLEVTYTKEVQTQHTEFDVKKDIPKDQTEFSAENKLESEGEAATQTNEATTVKEPYSNQETTEINPINYTAETGEVPASDVIDKIVTDDVGKLDQEEADHLQESTKSLPEDESFQILPTAASVENDVVDEPATQSEHTSTVRELHLNEEPAETSPINETVEQEVSTFDTTKKLVIDDGGKLDQNEEQIEEPTKSLQEDESVQQLPIATSVENEADDESSPEEKQEEAHIEVTYTKEDQTEFSAENKLESEAEATTQTKEATTAKEPHSNEETTEINPVNDTAETEEVPVSDVINKILTENVGKLDQEEADHLEESTKNESLQLLPTAASVEKDVVDDTAAQSEQTSTVRELHLNEDTPETSPINENVEQQVSTVDTTKKFVIDDGGKLDQDEEQIEEAIKSVQEDESIQTLPTTTSVENEVVDESSEEKHQEAAQTQETTTVKEPHSNEETAEINPTNDTVEQEVPASDTNEKLVIKGDGKFIQEEAKHIEDSTRCVPEDESVHTLPTTASVKNEAVDERSQEEIPPEAQLPVAYTKEDESESELSTENKLKSKSQVAAQYEETATIKQPHLEEETADINHTNDTEVKEEVPASNAKQKLVIEDEGKLEQDKAKQVQKRTKSVPEDESVQTLPTAASLKKEAVDGSSQEEIQQEAELGVTYEKEVQTPHNEFHVKKDIPEDESELSAENEQKLSQATTQNVTKPEVTDTKEDQRPDNDLVKNMEVLDEAFDLHKAPGNNSCVENEKKAEVQSEAKSQETVITKHLHLERPETAEISPSNDTKELEMEHEIAKPRYVSESVSAETTEQADTATTRKEAVPRDFNIATLQTDTRKLETQEAETTQFSSAKEDEGGDEFEKISPSSSISVISRDSQDTDIKVSHKKSHGILSGVGSKVKHSISKVKKAITGKSSNQKTSSPKENK